MVDPNVSEITWLWGEDPVKSVRVKFSNDPSAVEHIEEEPPQGVELEQMGAESKIYYDPAPPAIDIIEQNEVLQDVLKECSVPQDKWVEVGLPTALRYSLDQGYRGPVAAVFSEESR